MKSTTNRLLKKNLSKSLAAGLLIAVAEAKFASQAATLNYFTPSVHEANTAAMDLNLGVQGFIIEDFETTDFIPGLSINFTGNGFNASRTSLNAIATAANLSWDGSGILQNHPDNNATMPGIGQNRAQLTTFYFPESSSVGIGLSSFQSVQPASPQFPITNHRLYINGGLVGELESLIGVDWTPGLGRNGYLRFDAAAHESITSIGFENIIPNASGVSDLLAFDHFSYKPIPANVPESGSLLAPACLAWLGGWLVRSRALRPRE